ENGVGGARPPRASCPGKISGNPMNRLLDTGVPLKKGFGWCKRWFRCTLEDEMAYGKACADQLDRLRVQSECITDLLARQQFNREGMAVFRENWLRNFCKNRKY